MSKPKHISVAVDEFLAGIAGEVSLDELGAYWLVCMLIYSCGGAIRDDAAWMANKLRKVNPRSVRAAVDSLVRMGKVTRSEGWLLVNDGPISAERMSWPEWDSVRTMVFERDGWICTYCGSGEDLECDHVFPISRGGGNDLSNLTTACGSCNRAKGDRTPEEWRGA